MDNIGAVEAIHAIRAEDAGLLVRDSVAGDFGPACRLEKWVKGVHKLGHVLEMHTTTDVVKVEPLKSKLLPLTIDTTVLIEFLSMLLVQFANLSLITMLVDQ